MLRIRFHGRGGHGVKTASRILGTAAFLHGMQAQDSPVYGAERRGAAVAAYTRMDVAPICERGVILDPDLIVVADETLLGDRAAGVRVGCRASSTLFLNTDRTAAAVTAQCALPCPLLTLDLNALTLEYLGKRSALSAALGAAACALTGLPLEITVQAVREELADLHLAVPVIDRNAELARRVCGLLRPLVFSDHELPARNLSLRQPVYLPGPRGIPLILVPANAPARHTGSWRLFRPVIDVNACTRCGVCFACCPDSAIAFDAKGYPVIDVNNCKGCLICAEECPLHAIHEEREVRSW